MLRILVAAAVLVRSCFVCGGSQPQFCDEQDGTVLLQKAANLKVERVTVPDSSESGFFDPSQMVKARVLDPHGLDALMAAVAARGGEAPPPGYVGGRNVFYRPLPGLKNTTSEQIEDIQAAVRSILGTGGGPLAVWASPDTSTWRLWLAGVATAALAALGLSSDDCLWLTPFLVNDGYMPWAVFYVFLMEMIVFTAWAMVATGSPAEEAAPGIPVELALNAASAMLLLFYTATLFQEWWSGEEEVEDDDAKTSASHASSSTKEGFQGKDAGIMSDSHQPLTPADKEIGAALQGLHATSQPRIKARKRSLQQFVTICVIGSLDNCAIYVALLLANVFTGFQLFVGVLINSLLVVSICRGLRHVKLVVDTLNQLPLWVIVGSLTIWAFVNVAAAI
eukprot:TRINITY_DN71743_c0_g1_i2.p1 TRINITY_DN71743_c0_g1~~TRINITY_DN71743_c0_g1_i2.p1  ORF type:complete len:393 (-),score=85.86 TRINITY_DN71743_c0_g1_i2:13-1191(-)